MTEVFGRKWELLFEGTKLTEEYKMDFEVPFDDDPTIDISTLKIYNLSDDTIRKLKNHNMEIRLNAGYAGNVGTILHGRVKDLRTDWVGTDRITTVKVMDYEENWLEKTIQRTYKTDVEASTILIDVIKQAGLTPGYIGLPVNKIYKGGKTIDGTCAKIIADIVPDCGAKYNVSGGKINISDRKHGNETGMLIDSNNGMIGIPQDFVKEETYKVNSTVVEYKDVGGKQKAEIKHVEVDKKRKLYGYNIKMLLNHQIRTDQIIRLGSYVAPSAGLYRVVSGRHDGTEFITEAEIQELNTF